MTVCDKDAVIIEDKHIKPGLLNLLYGGGNFTNILSAYRQQRKIRYKE